MSSQQIKIKLTSFDHKLLDAAAKEITSKIRREEEDILGPIPLPRRVRRFTVNRSPHVDKKSREHFEIRTQKRLIIIKYPTPQTIEAIGKIELAAGVHVQIKIGGSN